MKKLFIVVFLLINLPVFAGNPVSVPINHPIYDFFDRMETMGYLNRLLDGIRPYSRGRAADLLQQLNEKRDELTSIDRRRLDDYLLDFRFEIDRTQKYSEMPDGKNWYSVLSGWGNFKNDFNRFFKQNHPEEENHVFLWESGGSNFYFDYQQNFTYEQRSDDVTRDANWQTYQVRGLIDDNFGYAVEVSLYALRGDESYVEEHPVLKGAWSKLHENETRYADRTGGELAWHSKYFDFTFAQQEIEWGPGESGKLTLSNNPEHYPYVSISKDWGWGKFIALHGKLQSFPEDTSKSGEPLYPDKWLAAHRLEFAPWKSLTLGINENFIYGYRYADWSYLVPFNFYRATQHNLRDRDNATISIDFEWVARPGSKLYGALFLDEFKRSKLFTDWYGNKHAFLIGLHQTDPFGIENLSLRLEYTAIMPWVYTHKYPVNSYTTDYQSLGHWAGPNSEVYYAHVSKDWHQRLTTGFKFQQYKHGDNYDDENIGGDILLGHNDLLGEQEQPRETRDFLEGNLTTEQKYEAYLKYEVFNDLFLTLVYDHFDIESAGSKTKLDEFHFGFELRY
ncbi:MAG: capsule assembly Wzi family protein [Calditrichaceae bacterium]